MQKIKTKSKILLFVSLFILVISPFAFAESWDHHRKVEFFGYDGVPCYKVFSIFSWVYVNIIYLHSGRPGWYITSYFAAGNIIIWKDYENDYKWTDVQQSVNVYKTYGRIYKVQHTISGKIVNKNNPNQYCDFIIKTWCYPTTSKDSVSYYSNLRDIKYNIIRSYS